MEEGFKRENRIEETKAEKEERHVEGAYEKPVELEVDWEPKTKEEKEGLKIVEAIADGGGDAYFAGGYGRDLAMSFHRDAYPQVRFNPHDIDIATNLAYEEVKKVLSEAGYSRFKETGGNFTVLNVIVELDGRHTEFEVASFRTEADYGKDRRPRVVEHTADIREDVSRRDFTVNGLYFDPVNKKIIDYVGGLRDIDERVLRTIGDPYERLVKEDPLRMLRYVRFLAKFNMKFDRGIREVIRENAGALHNLPAGRFRGENGELDKIFQSPRAAFAINNMARVGILKEVLPEVQELFGVRHTPEGKKAEVHKEGDVFRHSLESMRAIDSPEFLSAMRDTLGIDKDASGPEILEQFYQRYGADFTWAVMLHDIGKKQAREEAKEEGETAGYHFHGHEKFSAELARQIFSRFKFSNKSREKVNFLIANHMKAHHVTGARGSQLRKSARAELFRSPYAEELLFLNLADDMGNFADGRSAMSKVENFNAAWRILKEFRDEEKKREETLDKNKELARQIWAVFIPKEMQEKKQGFPVFGPVKELVQFMLDEDRLKPEEVRTFLEEVRDYLKGEGIDYLTIPQGEVGDFKEKVKKTLRVKYIMT